MNADQPKKSRNGIAGIAARWGLSIIIAAVLIAKTDFREILSRLSTSSFDPTMFTIGFLFCGTSVFLTLVRWRSILRAFGIDAADTEVMRIGMFSYALNLLALGSLGGDLGRAILITKDNTEKRRDAILSVGVDRIVGLYAMFVIAFVMVILGGLTSSADEKIRMTAWMTIAGTILVPVGLVLATRILRAVSMFERIRSWKPVVQLTEIADSCRGKAGILASAFTTSLILRTSTAVGIYFLGRSLMPEVPAVQFHLLAVSLALLTGCLPLPLNGLGAFETVLEFLFQTLPGTNCPPGYGVAVALVYRLFLVAVGLLGGIVFCVGRKSSVACEQRLPKRPHLVAPSSVVSL